jgi:hypothetical protein
VNSQGREPLGKDTGESVFPEPCRGDRNHCEGATSVAPSGLPGVPGIASRFPGAHAPWLFTDAPAGLEDDLSGQPLKGIRAIFHEPHPQHEIPQAMVRRLRIYLEEAGIERP